MTQSLLTLLLLSILKTGPFEIADVNISLLLEIKKCQLQATGTNPNRRGVTYAVLVSGGASMVAIFTCLIVLQFVIIVAHDLVDVPRPHQRVLCSSRHGQTQGLACKLRQCDFSQHRGGLYSLLLASRPPTATIPAPISSTWVFTRSSSRRLSSPWFCASTRPRSSACFVKSRRMISRAANFRAPLTP
jgi:hypothetical protein